MKNIIPIGIKDDYGSVVGKSGDKSRLIKLKVCLELNKLTAAFDVCMNR